MALENLIAYAVVLSLPLWLVAEEILHRLAARLKRAERRAAAVESEAPITAPAGLERRAPEGARAPAHASAA